MSFSGVNSATALQLQVEVQEISYTGTAGLDKVLEILWTGTASQGEVPEISSTGTACQLECRKFPTQALQVMHAR